MNSKLLLAIIGLALVPVRPSLAAARAVGAAGLADGTPVRLQLLANISADQAQDGDLVSFEVLEEVSVNGVAVIPRAAMAWGRVVEARRKHFLKAPRLVVAIDHVVLANGDSIPLRAIPSRLARDQADKIIDFAAAAPAWLYTPNREVRLGIQFTAYIDGNQPINVAPSAGAVPPPAAVAPPRPQVAPPLPAKPRVIPAPPPVQPRPSVEALPVASPPPQVRELADKQQEIHKLLDQAASTSDPAEQIKLLDQVLALDPTNAAATQARQDAQAKLDTLKAAEDHAQAQTQQKIEQGQENQDKRIEALKQAQQAFLDGDLARARSELEIAKSIDPNDPVVERLDTLIQSQARAKQVVYLVVSAFVLLLGFGITLFWWMRREQRQAYLEIVGGPDQGTRFALDQEVMRIGAVEQEGERENDIVLDDVDGTISPFHCEIHQQEGRVFVVDFASFNGTYVDGRRAPPGIPVLLKNRSLVELSPACALVLRFGRGKAKE